MYLYKYTIKSKQTLKIKNLKLSRDWSLLLKSKETRNNILTLDIFKSLIPTFGHYMIKEFLPKVGIKLLKYLMSEYYSLFPYFL